MRCGELAEQVAKQALHRSEIGLPAQFILAELAHLRPCGLILASARPTDQFAGDNLRPVFLGAWSRLAARRDIGGEIIRVGGTLRRRARW